MAQHTISLLVSFNYLKTDYIILVCGNDSSEYKLPTTSISDDDEKDSEDSPESHDVGKLLLCLGLIEFEFEKGNQLTQPSDDSDTDKTYHLNIPDITDSRYQSLKNKLKPTQESNFHAASIIDVDTLNIQGDKCTFGMQAGISKKFSHNSCQLGYKFHTNNTTSKILEKIYKLGKQEKSGSDINISQDLITSSNYSSPNSSNSTTTSSSSKIKKKTKKEIKQAKEQKDTTTVTLSEIVCDDITLTKINKNGNPQKKICFRFNSVKNAKLFDNFLKVKDLHTELLNNLSIVTIGNKPCITLIKVQYNELIRSCQNKADAFEYAYSPIKKIQKRINELQDEQNSWWPFYFRLERKQQKIDALKELRLMVALEPHQLSEHVSSIRTKHQNVDDGFFFSATKDLLDELSAWTPTISSRVNLNNTYRYT